MTVGKVVGVNGNMVSVEVDAVVSMNEVAYVKVDEARLKGEVIRVNGNRADLQVFELTKGIGVGDSVEFTGDLLAAKLGPGLLTRIYDGLQNPLTDLAERCGFFLQRGVYMEPLDTRQSWSFTPTAKPGDRLRAGDPVGWVPEGVFQHRIMVPFNLEGEWTLEWLAPVGDYLIEDTIAKIKGSDGRIVEMTMVIVWPVKRPITAYAERLKPPSP